MKGFLAAGLTLAIVSGALGQAGHGRGRLAGSVTDNDGNPVADAKVVITLLEHDVMKGPPSITPKINMRDSAIFETTTDKKGRWYFSGLAGGRWEIRASRAGYVATISVCEIVQISKNPMVKLRLEKAKEGFYSTDPAALERANEFFRQGEFDKARGLYMAYLAKEPGAVVVMTIIGDCWRQTGDYSSAVEAYQAVVELTSADPVRKDVLGVALAKIGECYLDKGDRERALTFLRRSVQASPGNDAVQAELGDLLFSMGGADEAVGHFLAALEIAPKRALLHYRLGLVYLKTADYDQARSCFLKVIDLEPTSDIARQSSGFLADLKDKKIPVF